MVRFLFGDSTPFPLEFDFLSTLEKFMTSATRVVQLEFRSKREERELAKADTERQAGLTTVSLLHERLLRALERSAGEAQHPAARDYTNRVGELAKRIRDEQVRAAKEATEQGEAALRAAGEQRVVDVRAYLEEFLLQAALPVVAWQVLMELGGEGKDARNTLHAVIQYPQRLCATFQLEAGGPFAHPCRVQELATGVELKVAIKKSFFKGVVTAEPMSVDDWIIGGFDADETHARIALRKKLDQKDSLVFRIRWTDQGLAGEVEHPGDPNASAVSPQLDAADLTQLDRLWKAIRTAAAPSLEHRLRLLGMTLDGVEVFERRLELGVVVRFVDVFAPLVTEIARRSPSEYELSLKRESDGGRREEIYLRRDDLLAKLEALASDGRAVFAPLGLEGWVPAAATIAPPAAYEDVDV